TFADIGITESDSPSDLALDASGDIYVGFAGGYPNVCFSPVVVKLDPNFRPLESVTISSCGAGMTMDSLGLIYVNDGDNVRRYDGSLSQVSGFTYKPGFVSNLSTAV